MCRASGFLAFCGVMLQTQAVLHSLSAHIEAEDLRLLSETNLAPSPCGGKRSTALACSDVLTEKPRATRPVKGLELRSVGCNPHAQPRFRTNRGARQLARILQLSSMAHLKSDAREIHDRRDTASAGRAGLWRAGSKMNFRDASVQEIFRASAMQSNVSWFALPGSPLDWLSGFFHCGHWTLRLKHCSNSSLHYHRRRITRNARRPT